MSKLKAGLFVFSAYWNCCEFIWGLLECLIETAFVLICLPFVPFLCVADALFGKPDMKPMKITTSNTGMPKELRV